MLTDLPIGAWSMSALLDTVGGRSAERSADLLMAAGVLAAVPTAASGLNDWSDTYGPDTRVGLVHARINTAALGLYVASLSSRAHGERTRGKIIGLAGLAVLTGAYLGGHLSFARGVNVNRTAWQEGPQDWTPVLPDADLPGLFDAPEVLDAFRSFATAGVGGEARILLQDAAAPQRAHAPLLVLAQRLPSVFLFREPIDPVDRAYASAYLTNDNGGYYFRSLGHRVEGEADLHGPGRARQLRNAFEQVWERSRPVTEYRALGI